MADAELWSRAVAGDAAAFTVFYQRHADKVFTHCWRRTDSATDSEDLTAEVFAVAWRKRATITLHEDVDILPWLLTTANFLLRHYHRSLRRARQLVRKFPRDTGLPDIAEEVADEQHGHYAAALALNTLNQLRIADREIIELCVIQGLTPAAVASASGEPAGTVRARLSRALARARALYEQLEVPESGPSHVEGGAR